MKPLACGYIRISGGVENHQVNQLRENEFRNYASTHGYDLGTVFTEKHAGSQEAFDELITELKRADAHHVVVPSLYHFSRSEITRNQMLDRLRREANAETVELSDYSCLKRCRQ